MPNASGDLLDHFQLRNLYPQTQTENFVKTRYLKDVRCNPSLFRYAQLVQESQQQLFPPIGHPAHLPWVPGLSIQTSSLSALGQQLQLVPAYQLHS